MKHFDITQWADYARGLADPAARTAMAEHLSAGCRKCQTTVSLLEKVVPAAKAEVSHQVPDYAVHCAKAIYVLQQPETVHILSGLRSKLVFDSFCEPMPAGVRSQHRISRQTLYEAGDYAMDLRQEHERGSRQVTLVGQIARRTAPGQAVADVPVYLLAGKSVVARTVSNQFGEFQMEYDPRKHLRLYASVESPRNQSSAPSSPNRSSQRPRKGGAVE